MFGVHDVDTSLEDPHSHQNLRPTAGWALQILPNRIVLARYLETGRRRGSAGPEKTFALKPEEDQPANLSGQTAFDVAVKIDGSAVAVVANGRTYHFKARGERTGFFGFDFHGSGYASVEHMRVTAN